jgi:4-amino-4-deoxy-L-arabinose transferase-like glycosyltransferase
MKNSPLSQTRIWSALLVILLALGGLLRLFDITDPPLDFHPTRQLRNFIVARGIYFSMIGDPSAQTFRNVTAQYEPPIVESIVAVTYRIAGGESYAVPRIWESLFWLLAGLALFDLMRRAISPWAGLIGLAYYLVLPFAVQASRSFQPDPLMTSALYIGAYCLYRWSESYGVQELAPAISDSKKEAWKWAILSGFLLGFAILVKAIIVFLVAGVAIAAVLYTLQFRFFKSPQVWTMLALTLLPPFLFYVVIHPGNNTEYVANWSVAMAKLLLSTDFYSKWLAFIGSLLGLTAVFLSLAGTALAQPRLRALLVGLWAGYIVYGLVLPFQMYTHSYYHIQLIPIVAVGIGAALHPLIERVTTQDNFGRVAFVALIVGVIGYQSWVSRSVLIAEDFRHEPEYWKNIGDAIPPEAKVIGLTQDYGYRLLYFGYRKVSLWPLSTQLAEVRHEDNPDFTNRFDELTADRDYFLVTASSQLDKQPGLKDLLSQYPIAKEGDGFILYDLKP